MFGGDFNTDLTRENYLHTVVLTRYMREESFKCAMSFAGSGVHYTYENKITGSRSTIDHFLLTENLFTMLKSCKSVHRGDNLPDHTPVEIKLGIDVYHSEKAEHCHNSDQCEPYFRSVPDGDTIRYKGLFCVPQETVVCSEYHCTDLRNLRFE